MSNLPDTIATLTAMLEMVRQERSDPLFTNCQGDEDDVRMNALVDASFYVVLQPEAVMAFNNIAAQLLPAERADFAATIAGSAELGGDLCKNKAGKNQAELLLNTTAVVYGQALRELPPTELFEIIGRTSGSLLSPLKIQEAAVRCLDELRPNLQTAAEQKQADRLRFKAVLVISGAVNGI